MHTLNAGGVMARISNVETRPDDSLRVHMIIIRIPNFHHFLPNEINISSELDIR
jgi:hypothetical protein